MAGFRNVAELVDAELDGRGRYASFRKLPTQNTTVGTWYDLSYAPGTPVPNYYAATPLTSVALRRSTDIGLDHGQNVAPSSKHLRRLTISTTNAATVPAIVMLLDYLLFYAFIDEGTVDVQSMVNTIGLPRYADGGGVQIMAVSVGSRSSNQTFQVTYTNSAGVAGRLSQIVSTTTNAANGSIVTSERAGLNFYSPFIPLAAGDEGVRSVESVQMISGTDVGLFTLVLVKPLADAQIRGVDAPVEIDYLLDTNSAPIIVDDAYLNLLIQSGTGSLAAAQIFGDIYTTWSV